MLIRRSRIAGHVKEAGIAGKATGGLGRVVGGLGQFALEHPILALAGIGGASGAYLGMRDRGLRGLSPGHMRARLYGHEAPVVQPQSFKPVNPVGAHQRLSRQIRDWSSKTSQPWG